MVIPCLCLFIALSSLFSELVGACLPQTLLHNIDHDRSTTDL